MLPPQDWQARASRPAVQHPRTVLGRRRPGPPWATLQVRSCSLQQAWRSPAGHRHCPALARPPWPAPRRRQTPAWPARPRAAWRAPALPSPTGPRWRRMQRPARPQTVLARGRRAERKLPRPLEAPRCACLQGLPRRHCQKERARLFRRCPSPRPQVHRPSRVPPGSPLLPQQQHRPARRPSLARQSGAAPRRSHRRRRARRPAPTACAAPCAPPWPCCRTWPPPARRRPAAARRACVQPRRPRPRRALAAPASPAQAPEAPAVHRAHAALPRSSPPAQAPRTTGCQPRRSQRAARPPQRRSAQQAPPRGRLVRRRHGESAKAQAVQRREAGQRRRVGAGAAPRAPRPHQAGRHGLVLIAYAADGLAFGASAAGGLRTRMGLAASGLPLRTLPGWNGTHLGHVAAGGRAGVSLQARLRWCACLTGTRARGGPQVFAAFPGGRGVRVLWRWVALSLSLAAAAAGRLVNARCRPVAWPACGSDFERRGSALESRIRACSPRSFPRTCPLSPEQQPALCQTTGVLFLPVQRSCFGSLSKPYAPAYGTYHALPRQHQCGN